MERDGEGGLTVEQKAKAWDHFESMLTTMEKRTDAEHIKLKPIAEAIRLMVRGCIFLTKAGI